MPTTTTAYRYNKIFTFKFVLLTGVLLSSSLSATELPFKIAIATEQLTTQWRQFDASVEAVHQSVISSETSGRVTEIRFDMGDKVERDQVLVRVTRVQQQAGLSAAIANVSEAEARFNEAETEQKRLADIFEKKLISRSALDKADTELKAAKQKLEATRANLKSASAKLKYTLIRAPFSGVVVNRFVELGEAVSPGTPVMEGLSLSELRVVSHIPQSMHQLLRDKPQARVHLPNQETSAVVINKITLSPQADSTSHSFLFRGMLPKTNNEFYPGMYVKLSVAISNINQLLIPKNSVVYRSELTAVYVVEDNQVSLRQVRVGKSMNENIAVLSGLQAGEKVAIEPIKAGIFLKEDSLKENSTHNQNGGV